MVCCSLVPLFSSQAVPQLHPPVLQLIGGLAMSERREFGLFHGFVLWSIPLFFLFELFVVFQCCFYHSFTLHAFMVISFILLHVLLWF